MLFASSDREAWENLQSNPNKHTHTPTPQKNPQQPTQPMKLEKDEISFLTRKISSADRQLLPIHNTT